MEKRNVITLIKEVLAEHPECYDDEMALYFYYVCKCNLPILRYPKMFYDKELRDSYNIKTFGTISREVRKIKAKRKEDKNG